MKISEFAELLGVPASTLRYYEKKGFLKTERVNGIRELSAFHFNTSCMIQYFLKYGLSQV